MKLFVAVVVLAIVAVAVQVSNLHCIDGKKILNFV